MICYIGPMLCSAALHGNVPCYSLPVPRPVPSLFPTETSPVQRQCVEEVRERTTYWQVRRAAQIPRYPFLKLYSERLIEGRAKGVQTVDKVDDADAWVHGHVYWNMLMPCTTAKVRLCDQRSLKRVASEAEAQAAAA